MEARFGEIYRWPTRAAASAILATVVLAGCRGDNNQAEIIPRDPSSVTAETPGTEASVAPEGVTSPEVVDCDPKELTDALARYYENTKTPPTDYRLGTVECTADNATLTDTTVFLPEEFAQGTADAPREAKVDYQLDRNSEGQWVVTDESWHFNDTIPQENPATTSAANSELACMTPDELTQAATAFAIGMSRGQGESPTFTVQDSACVDGWTVARGQVAYPGGDASQTWYSFREKDNTGDGQPDWAQYESGDGSLADAEAGDEPTCEVAPAKIQHAAQC